MTEGRENKHDRIRNTSLQTAHRVTKILDTALK